MGLVFFIGGGFVVGRVMMKYVLLLVGVFI